MVGYNKAYEESKLRMNLNLRIIVDFKDVE